MQLQQFTLDGVRNIKATTLGFSERFNVFCGKNGSGKTSLLEGIHILATGRSFRTKQFTDFITFNKDSCLLAGFVQGESALPAVHLGIMRRREGGFKMRIAEQDCTSVAELAKVLPIQFMNTDTYALLDGAPNIRRQFLDWGMFHVEHAFFPAWQRYARTLKQRNAALKRGDSGGRGLIEAWDAELVEAGSIVETYRRQFVSEFVPLFQALLAEFLTLPVLRVEYKQGRPQDLSLELAIKTTYQRDLLMGYTGYGPHRADVQFYLGEVPAKTFLSRGQLKLFVSVLFLAREEWFFQKLNRRSVFLIDDIYSELDSEATQRLLQCLAVLNGQVFLTGIAAQPLLSLLENLPCHMFHVEHGGVIAN